MYVYCSLNDFRQYVDKYEVCIIIFSLKQKWQNSQLFECKKIIYCRSFGLICRKSVDQCLVGKTRLC